MLKAFATNRKEYDFGGYKHGFAYAKECGLLAWCDKLILCNDSVYTPVRGSLLELVEVWRDCGLGRVCTRGDKEFSATPTKLVSHAEKIGVF